MPSPFPGMNPYLEQEQAWHDFHERTIPLAAERLGAQVRPRYFVKIEEHIYIHELAGEARQLVSRADVSVGQHSGASHQGKGTKLLEGPASLWMPAVDVERES